MSCIGILQPRSKAHDKGDSRNHGLQDPCVCVVFLAPMLLGSVSACCAAVEIPGACLGMERDSSTVAWGSWGFCPQLLAFITTPFLQSRHQPEALNHELDDPLPYMSYSQYYG